jgi:predicted XRE-type DNA-binding protein
MKGEKLELVRGSGNVFRDLGRENADLEQLKALLAAEIIKALDREELTVRAAQARSGVAAADFSRIRNADLSRFTADRLMSILNRLGSRVDVKVRVKPIEGSGARLPLNPRGTPASQGSYLSHGSHGGVPRIRSQKRAVSPAEPQSLLRGFAGK